ncbi:MAG: acetate--CoA ligase family protein [Firmicutes bacterium]|nr:acetate--CoA ligase family protein [Bacillota bacterium]
MAQQHNNLDLFFYPSSVALVGASSRTGPAALNVLEQMLNSGYQGRIYPVNPRGGVILGLPVHASVTDIAEPVDLAVVATPRTEVPAVVRQCVAKGIKAVLIITQGFADANDRTGQELHREIMAAIAGTQTRLVGPNTIGLVNSLINLHTSFIEFDFRTAPVGLICQSGIFVNAADDFSGGVGIGVDIGNSVDIGFTECLEYLAARPEIKVINIHMEGLREGRDFLAAARRITPHKPVLVLKTGATEEGARAVCSHSGSMAGADDVFTAAFAQSGIIRVDQAARFAGLNRTLTTYRSMRGRRVGLITVSGGAGIMAADAAGTYGLEIANFSPATMAALQEMFPDWMSPGNPADIWPAAMARGYREVLTAALDKMLADDAVDAVLCNTTAYLDPDTDPQNLVGPINEVAARYPHKPTAVWTIGPHKTAYAAKYAGGAVVAYSSPDEAMYCLSRLYYYHSAVKGGISDALNEEQPAANSGFGTVQTILATALRAGRTVLDYEALDILEAYGIPVVRRYLARSREEAASLAGILGYPLVMKIASPDVPHKSDWGGVLLNITSAEQAAQAYQQIEDQIRSRLPEVRMDGIMLQRQAAGSVEVILGARRDPQFGPVLVYGLGGIYTELVRDVSCRVAPVSGAAALAMMKETCSYPILSGARGREAVDIKAVADCLVNLGLLLRDHPEIAEADINPLLVTAAGCLAVDALMVLAGDDDE